jgi:predicted DCC family thiol-disulfide oxidoreductase YuxK
VILSNGAILQKSKAVYYILMKVKTLRIVRVLIFLTPTFLSNLIYDFVAKTRYLFFGKYKMCPVLDVFKDRFLA